MPPLSGTENNPFKDSCGAFIRSEIWACIAPGCPEIAAKYAYEDAIVDHGNGEGTFAEVFCAALQSAAFVVKDTYKLIEIGLSYIPDDCGVARAIRCVIDSYKSGKTWLEARHELLTHYKGYCGFTISEEEREKGFADGKRGWDAPSNIGIIIIGWLYGKGDFEKSICITVNCGEDTDCTAATYGSIYGIINGIDAIPEKWIKPIGRTIKTAFLNLGELGYFGSDLPADIDQLTERVERIAKQVLLRNRQLIELSEDAATDLSDLKDSQLYSGSHGKSIFRNPGGPVYKFGSMDVMVDYVNGPVIMNNIPKKIRLIIENRYKTPDSLNIRWYTPDGWSVSPAKEGKLFLEHAWLSDSKVSEFELCTENAAGTNRFAIELTADGKHTVMLIPVILLSGNLQ